MGLCRILYTYKQHTVSQQTGNHSQFLKQSSVRCAVGFKQWQWFIYFTVANLICLGPDHLFHYPAPFIFVDGTMSVDSRICEASSDWRAEQHQAKLVRSSEVSRPPVSSVKWQGDCMPPGHILLHALSHPHTNCCTKNGYKTVVSREWGQRREWNVIKAQVPFPADNLEPQLAGCTSDWNWALLRLKFCVVNFT